MLRISLLLWTAFTTNVAANPCHCMSSGSPYNCDLPVPCGAPNKNGFVSCCVSGDTCGADGFCHFTHTQSGTSGYYLASCTDPTYSDPSCPITCTENPTQDVVYNATSGLWACCYNGDGSGTPDCANPGKDTFQAPPPQNLFSAPFAILTASPANPVYPTTVVKASVAAPSPSPSASPSSEPQSALSSSPSIATGPSRSTSRSGTSSSVYSSRTSNSALTSSTATSASQTGETTAAQSTTAAVYSSSSSSSSASSSSSGLSTGAKAGIAIAVVVGVIAMLAVAFVVHRRRKQQQSPAGGSRGEPQILPRQNAGKHNWHELDSSRASQEHVGSPSKMHGYSQQDVKEIGVGEFNQRQFRSELSGSVPRAPAELYS